MYTITLADGTVLDNLRLNGNNFISGAEITESIFTGNLSYVTIMGPDGVEEYHNMALVQVKQYGVEWWFVLRVLTDRELRERAMEAEIEELSAIKVDWDMMAAAYGEGVNEA